MRSSSCNEKNKLKASLYKKANSTLKTLIQDKEKDSGFEESEQWPARTKVRIIDEAFWKVHCGQEFMVAGVFKDGQLRLLGPIGAPIKVPVTAVIKVDGLEVLASAQPAGTGL